MDVIVLFGPSAVGKMTVGQAIAERSDLRLLHNHMTIDLIIDFFDFGTPPFGRLVRELRRRIVEECAGAGGPGLVLTYMWALDLPSERTELDYYLEPVRATGGQVYWVELAAGQQARLERNRSANRLLHKPKTKSDVDGSERRLLEHDHKHVFNTDEEHPFPFDEPYLRIDNTDLLPEAVADRILAAFEL